MNRVHQAIITHIRDASKAEGGKLADHLLTLTDAQIVKMMFSSYRGKGNDARGLRLTNTGLQMMMEYFRHYEVKFPESRRLQTGELIYLDRRATLPYFCSDEKLVVFETELGMKLKLWDGDISRLAAIESY